MEYKCVNFAIWDSRGFDCTTEQLQEYINRIKNLGVNTVLIDYQYAYDRVTGEHVPDAFSWGDNQNTPISAVESAIKRFQEVGLDVVLSPHTNSWDSKLSLGYGNMNISNVDVDKLDVKNFFDNYKNQLIEAANISQKYSLPILNIGVEMNCLDQFEYTHYWLDIIQDLRKLYTGKLTYAGIASPWDLPDAKGVSFYSELDYIGLSIYPFLGYGESDADAYELFKSAYQTGNPFGSKVGSWTNYLGDLYENFKKPIFVTETGFSSVDGAATRGYTSPAPEQQLDFQEQIDATFSWLSFLYNIPTDQLSGVSVWGATPKVLGVTDGKGGFAGKESWHKDFYDNWFQRTSEFIGKPVETTLQNIFEATNQSTLLVGLDFSADQGADLQGTIGSDVFALREKANSYNGGLGLDSLVIRDNFKNWAINSSKSEAVFSLVNSRSDIKISNIERFHFADRSLALDVEGQQSAGRAYRVYKAAFNRDPMQGDTGGLGYWIAQIDNGMDLIEVSARFVDSNEFRSLYGTNPTNAQFLTKLYQNVLGRNPEASGYNWWLNELNTNPSKTKAKVLADFAESSENQAGVASLIGNGITYEPWVN
jgi:hypothetical protein